MSELTTEQKEVIALNAQSARDGGIHDVLVYLTVQINLEGLEIVKNGTKMPIEPFDSGMHYDCLDSGVRYKTIKQPMTIFTDKPHIKCAVSVIKEMSKANFKLCIRFKISRTPIFEIL